MMDRLSHSNPRATIAQADLNDVQAIKAMVDGAYSKYIERMGKRPAPMEADYSELIRNKEVSVLRDQQDNKVVGAIVLCTRDQDDSILIKDVVVHADAQRRGYGRLLMEFAETIALDKGFRSLTLFTNIKMHENLVMYPKLGFVETERRIEDGYDRVYFRKDLVWSSPLSGLGLNTV